MLPCFSIDQWGNCNMRDYKTCPYADYCDNDEPPCENYEFEETKAYDPDRDAHGIMEETIRE